MKTTTIIIIAVLLAVGAFLLFGGLLSPSEREQAEIVDGWLAEQGDE